MGTYTFPWGWRNAGGRRQCSQGAGRVPQSLQNQPTVTLRSVGSELGIRVCDALESAALSERTPLQVMPSGVRS